MKKYCYDTPIGLAKEILKQVPHKQYKSVIDICCGAGNLLMAAKNIYKNVSLVGVDIDDRIQLAKLNDINFHISDGRKFAETMKNENATYDLILSNPPFGKLNEHSKYWELSKIESKYLPFLRSRYETEMMLANIMLVHLHSVMVFILPITFLNGQMYNNVRKCIAAEFTVLKIIELPDDTFGSSRISTVAVIIEKNDIEAKKKDVKYGRAVYDNVDWTIYFEKKIPYKHICDGKWYTASESSANIRIKRGSIHSGEMTETGETVLHCSSNFRDGKWMPAHRYTQNETGVLAQIGDIIINRIGRCAGYWWVNDLSNVKLSDCLFVISHKDINEEILEKLNQNSIEGRLNIPLRGVSTYYITIKDIQSILS